MLDKSKLEWALEHAARGWYVFPCHAMRNDGVCSCGDPHCKSPAKHPITLHGEKDATNDHDRIRAMWSTRPDANIAVATGPSGLVVMDLDGEEGQAQFATLRLKHGDTSPQTLVVKTGRPGGL